MFAAENRYTPCLKVYPDTWYMVVSDALVVVTLETLENAYKNDQRQNNTQQPTTSANHCPSTPEFEKPTWTGKHQPSITLVTRRDRNT